MCAANLTHILENYLALRDATDNDSDMLAGIGGESHLTSSLE